MSTTSGPIIEATAETGKDPTLLLTPTTALDHDLERDPLYRRRPSQYVQEGEYVLLHFTDSRQMFAQCFNVSPAKTKSFIRFNKKKYSTSRLVGLPYGTVLEVANNNSYLQPLEASEKLLPDLPTEFVNMEDEGGGDYCDDPNEEMKGQQQSGVVVRDNRSIVDNNTAQRLDQDDLDQMRASGTTGADIVKRMVEHSNTFAKKNTYSKVKYIQKKQIKHQLRCRIVPCTGANICEYMHWKDPRRVMKLREDTLGQILSYSNVSAGCQTMIFETCLGVVTGAMAQRMGGYGRIVSIYSGQQPSYTDMIAKFNLSFAEQASIKWVHSGDVFRSDNRTDEVTFVEDKKEQIAATMDTEVSEEEEDEEQKDREALVWPCELQSHTRKYLEKERKDEKKLQDFLYKRSSRFVRKLCRQTPLEAVQMMRSRQSDSIVIACRYDPTETLLTLLPYLALSSPFVVFCEFIEPLTKCFREVQQKDLAINLRLTDTWMREYQVLEGRTHPNMNMSQSGGYILTGIKLDPVHGHNDLDETKLQELKDKIGGRRKRYRKKGKDTKSNSTKQTTKRQRT